MSLLVSSALLAAVVAQPAPTPFVTWNSNVVLIPTRIPAPRDGDRVMLRQNDVVERKQTLSNDVIIQIEPNETILLRGAGSRVTYLGGNGDIKPMFWLRGKMTFEATYTRNVVTPQSAGGPKSTPRKRLVRGSNRSLGTLGTKFHLETMLGAPEQLCLHVLEGMVYCQYLDSSSSPALVFPPSSAPVVIPDIPQLPD